MVLFGFRMAIFTAFAMTPLRSHLCSTAILRHRLFSSRNWHYEAPIRSSSNPVVKEFKIMRKKARKEGIVVLEGHRMVIDAIELGNLVPRLIMVTEDAFEAPLGDALLGALKNEAFTDNIRLVHGDIMKSVSETKSPQGVVAVFNRPGRTQVLPEGASKILVLDRIMDPGNIGTLVRTAYGLGWDAVLAIEGVDPFCAKAVRSSMGSCLTMPIVDSCKWEDPQEILSLLQDRPIYMAEADFNSKPHFEADLKGRCALVIGSEASGISQEAKEAFQGRSAGELTTIYVPLVRDLESLNAAVAGAVIMGEATRQGRKPTT